MASKRAKTGAGSLFALGLAARAGGIGVAIFGTLQLLPTQRYYATCTVLLGIGVLLILDLIKYIHRTDRLLHQIITGLAAGDLAQPSSRSVALTGLQHSSSGLLDLVAAANAARHRQQQRIDFFEALLDNINAALFVVERSGKFEPVNRAAHRLLGRSHEDLTTHLPNIHNGQRTIVRLSDGNRALLMAVDFSTSILERRLASLQNVESELDAVELQAWQNLVRILAHEMMNSLTPISSLAASIKPRVERIRDEFSASTDASVMAAEACMAADVIARRSSSLLDFVERYRKVMELPRPQLKHLSPDEVLCHVESLMAPLMAQKNIAFNVQCISQLNVLADVELLEQALINLLHNAINAVDEVSTPCIEMLCFEKESWMAISVRDNGSGIDLGLLDQIFVPFFTTKTDGAGIGLSLVQKIALAHRGRVEVAANLPHGAIFTLLLPLTL